MRVAVIAIFALAACATSAPAQERATAYLNAPPLDPHAVLASPPARGSAEEATDRAAYVAALALVDTPRWDQAIADANERVEAVAANYSEAAGRSLNDVETPALMRLLRRAYADMSPSVQAAKDAFNRPRPFAADAPDAPLCQPTPAEQRASAARSYPSGHAVTGWLTAYILAAALPERADAIFARARSYGESRVVCRVHHASDVTAGRELAAALFARLQTNEAFHADLLAARAELR